VFKSQALSALSQIVHSNMPEANSTILAVQVKIQSMAKIQHSHLSEAGAAADRESILQVRGGSNITLSPPKLLRKSYPDSPDTVMLMHHLWMLMRRTPEGVEMWLRPQTTESNFEFQCPDGDYFHVASDPANWLSAACELSTIAIQDKARVAVYAKSLVVPEHHLAVEMDQEFIVGDVLDVHCKIRNGCSSSRPERLHVSNVHPSLRAQRAA